MKKLLNPIYLIAVAIIGFFVALVDLLISGGNSFAELTFGKPFIILFVIVLAYFFLRYFLGGIIFWLISLFKK